MNQSVFPYKAINDSFSKRQREQQRIDAEIKAVLNQLESRPERRAAFEGLLTCVRAHTDLLKPALGRGSIGWAAPLFLIQRLKSLAARQGNWLRPPETWHPTAGNLRPIFRSLA